MTPFPINRAWIPSVVAAAIVVGFLVFSRRGAAPAAADAGPLPGGDSSVAAQTGTPATASRSAVPERVGRQPTAPAVVAPVMFQVELRASATSRAASDVLVAGERIGTLDRTGRGPCLGELTRRAADAARDASRTGAELRPGVRTAAGTDQTDASDVLHALNVAGVRGVSLDGAALFRGGTSAR